MSQQYEDLVQCLRRAETVESIATLLRWDQETYMPIEASPIRAKQLKLLAEIGHSFKTSPEYEQKLSALIDLNTGAILDNSLTEEYQDALKECRREFVRSKKLPTSFVEQMAGLTSEAVIIWQEAKQDNCFSSFEPHLARIVEMQQEKADLLGYATHPYDALLEDYEPGCTTHMIDTLFKEIKEPLMRFLTILKRPPETPHFHLSKLEQLEVSQMILNLIGFDSNRGRLDTSAHPFSTTYHPMDSRITICIEPEGLIHQVFTTLHEAGHSFYEMGLPEKHWGTPLAKYVSLGIHESQSRLWETRIGRSFAFWEFLFPQLQQKYPQYLQGVELSSLFTAMNAVMPSFIRTEADEVTYPLHVILRFEIEKELMEGTLLARDIPDRWNDGMKELLGIEPPSDVVGCLQDIHWSMGAFGYFPTYTLGNIYAAELFTLIETDFPDWEAHIRQGEFHFLKQWLHDTVWQYGRRYNSKTLFQKILGREVSSKPYLDYLMKKYK